MIPSAQVERWYFFMHKHHKKLYTGIFIVIFFAVIIVSFLTLGKNFQVLKAQIVNPEIEKIEDQKTESATILAGSIKTQLSFPPNTLFYDALVQAKNTGAISFGGKNYSGLGFFMTDIGSLHSGSGKNLLYYINGKGASVGVSFYTLKNGDIIEWKLE